MQRNQLSRRQFLKASTGLALGAGLLGACTPAPMPGAATNQPSSAAAPAEDGGSITCLFHGAALEGPYWSVRLGMFADAHPEIEFIGLPSANDSEYVQKISTMVAGGTPPDMVKLSGGRMLATASKGIYEDITPRLESSELFQRIWAELPDEGKELTYCGQQIGIPQDLDFRQWFYNKDLFDAAGVAYPTLEWTWDDLVSMGLAITNKDENIWFVIPGVVSFQDASDWYWQAGGTLFSADCMKANIAEEPNILAMQFLVDLFKTHQIAPSPTLGLGDIGISFDTGRVGMSMSSSQTMAAQLGPESTWDFNWGAVFAPTGPGGGNGFVKSNGYAMVKGAARPELAWTFIEWWYTDETHTTFAQMGELVPRTDLRNQYSLANIPEDLHPSINRAGTHGRGLERCPAWSEAQKHWKQELDTAITGDVYVAQAMQTAAEKAAVEIGEVMASACQA
jgi:multiple sugar transport system substrate-binding protein